MTRAELLAALKSAKGPDFNLDIALREFFDGRDEWLTHSLDAAISLVERVRPGWHWSIYDTNGFDKACAQIEPPEYSFEPTNGEAATPALALLIALLSSDADQSGYAKEAK